MKTEQYILTDGILQGNLGAQADLVLLFGATKRIKEKGLINMIRTAYPNACIFGCTTAGEIIGTQVLDDSLIVTAVSFSATKVAGAMVKVATTDDSHKAGAELAKSLAADDLKHVFVLSEGLNINGSELVRGLTENLPLGTTLTEGFPETATDSRKHMSCSTTNQQGMPSGPSVSMATSCRLATALSAAGIHSGRSDLLPVPRETFFMSLTANRP
jgi:hypothetical protein